MRSTRLTAAGAITAAVVLGLAGTATAHGGADDAETIRIQDDCDPKTFAEVPGGCVGDGDTTFDELVEELIEDGEHGKWRFHPDETHIDHDEALHAHNQGGEFHTFTMVDEFGAGCVPEINELLGLGDEPVPEICATPAFFTELIPPGVTVEVDHLAPGVYRFLCLIHPWMKSTVEVERD
jgi:plastocyanin